MWSEKLLIFRNATKGGSAGLPSSGINSREHSPWWRLDKLSPTSGKYNVLISLKRRIKFFHLHLKKLCNSCQRHSLQFACLRYINKMASYIIKWRNKVMQCCIGSLRTGCIHVNRWGNKTTGIISDLINNC